MSQDFYRALEERFRASREEILRRLGVYRPFLDALRTLRAQPRAFDIGCGRGEWIEWLVEQGFQAQGVDLDDSMLAACHERGLDVRNRDALETLKAAQDASFELVSAFHVVEHLPFDYLRDLLAEAHRVLAPGGLIILETPNSENLVVGTNNFYFDPTHERPVPALFLDFLCDYSGFGRRNVLRLQEDPALHNANAEIGLWQVLYGVSPDYAVVAQKGTSAPEIAAAFDTLFAQRTGFDLPALANRHDEAQRHVRREVDDTLRSQSERIEQLTRAIGVMQANHEREIAELRARVNGDLRAELRAEIRGELDVLPHRWLRWMRRTERVAVKLRHLDRPGFKHLVARSLRPPVSALAGWTERSPGAQRFLSRTGKGMPSVARRVSHYVDVIRNLDTGLAKDNEVIVPVDLSAASSGYSERTIYIARQLVRRALPGNTTRTDNARPRLAYVSPLLPLRTGIADYSGELLPQLANHYDIDVVVAQECIEDAWVNAHGIAVRNADWLREHAAEFDAVLYHVGNSGFHTWIASLLADVPGTVVLHDFYLSGLIWAQDVEPGLEGTKWRELYYAHGNEAIIALRKAVDEGEVAFRYPFNRRILEQANGVIVHSPVSFRLAEQWLGTRVAADWALVPHLRVPPELVDTRAARAELGIASDAFVVCSFGELGVTKLNDRLLEAWIDSALSADPRALLVFVGQLGETPYGEALRQRIAESGRESQIRITGWADLPTFRGYLAAADVGVQLRTLSRGETSGTVLDCMNHGLPTIVNANGSMADLPDDAVLKLRDDFDSSELVAALEHLHKDEQARNALGQRALAAVRERHDPARCAEGYREALERFSARSRRLAEQAAGLPARASAREVFLEADRIEQTLPAPLRQPQLLLDITATHAHDRNTGIERVARALTVALLENPPAGYRVEPVYLQEHEGAWHYRYASAYTAKLFDIPSCIPDSGIDVRDGDRLIALDISGDAFVHAMRHGLFDRMRASGVHCRVLVHDLLPITRPSLFPDRAKQHFDAWLNAVLRLDGAVCVTQTVAEELRAWIRRSARWREGAFAIDYSHHGADLVNSAPTCGMPESAEQLFSALRARPSVLMVGTIEPRKNHEQALSAFEQLWARGADINLVIVGREGWTALPDNERRGIPALVERLRNHPQRNGRLFWLDDVSDECLEQLYGLCNGLLACSEDEGFGLPLIEAAQHGMPILARDIPVFREVAGEHAAFFQADSAGPLADALERWVADGFVPESSAMQWLSWRRSAEVLSSIILR